MGIARLGGRTAGRRLLAAGGLLLVLAGCGSASGSTSSSRPPEPQTRASTSTPISPADLLPGQPVPAPRAAPVITVSGRIAAHNRGRTLALDMGALDRLGVSRVSLYEPWTKQDLQFQGVWLADLLRVAQADSAATGVHLTALDDYRVDLTMAEVRAGGIFLATKRGDGSAIPIDEGGPTRVVFVGGVPSGRNADQWIWSLKTLDVR
jgi:hypothetical protein